MKYPDKVMIMQPEYHNLKLCVSCNSRFSPLSALVAQNLQFSATLHAEIPWDVRLNNCSPQDHKTSTFSSRRETSLNRQHNTIDISAFIPAS